MLIDMFCGMTVSMSISCWLYTLVLGKGQVSFCIICYNSISQHKC